MDLNGIEWIPMDTSRTINISNTSIIVFLHGDDEHPQSLLAVVVAILAPLRVAEDPRRAALRSLLLRRHSEAQEEDQHRLEVL